MKIKKVCELTGLSDRAIRFYIEQELIEPAFKESYLGRRTYDFSDADVELLKNISVLRKFGFTLVEIKLLILDSNNSVDILPKIHERKLYQRDIDAEAFYALSRLDDKREYTITEIASNLREPSKLLPPSRESLEVDIKNVVSWTLTVLGLVFYVMLSLCSGSFSIINNIANVFKYRYIYAEASKLFVVIVLFCIGCGILASMIVFRKKLNGYLAKVFPLILCLTSIIVSLRVFSESGVCSYTDDFDNYKVYDKASGLKGRAFEKNVFPETPLNVDKDSKYRYKYEIDAEYTYTNTIDLYAEWRVDEDTFEREIERVLSVFEELKETYKEDYYVYEKNGYTCYVFFYGENTDSPLSSRSYFDSENRKYIDQSDRLDIFVADARKNFGYPGYYDCGIFAYNKETKMLRYSYSDGFEGNIYYDISYNKNKAPYYTQVEW